MLHSWASKLESLGLLIYKSQTCALIKSFDLFCWVGKNASQNFIFNFAFHYHFYCSYVDISLKNNLDSLVGCLLFILYIYQLLAYFSFLFFPLYWMSVIQVDPQYQWFPSSVSLVPAKYILIHWWQFVLCFVFVCFANSIFLNIISSLKSTYFIVIMCSFTVFRLPKCYLVITSQSLFSVALQCNACFPSTAALSQKSQGCFWGSFLYCTFQQ